MSAPQAPKSVQNFRYAIRNGTQALTPLRVILNVRSIAVPEQ